MAIPLGVFPNGSGTTLCAQCPEQKSEFIYSYRVAHCSLNSTTLRLRPKT